MADSSAADADAGDSSSPDACVPVAETCNGFDDDCNGSIDDGPAPRAECMTAFAGGTGVCAAGACELTSCSAPMDDCDGLDSTGCETDLDTSALHCGACAAACSAAEECIAGSCEDPEWSLAFGGDMPDGPVAVAADTLGNVYVLGTFTESFDAGGGTLTNSGGADLFLASYDVFGSHRWSVAFGTSGQDVGAGIATDSSGNLYVTGHTDSALDFGDGALPTAGGSDAFVASFTSDGAHRWDLALATPSNDEARGIAVGGSAVYVVGTTLGALNVGFGANTARGLEDAYLVRLSTAGTVLWSRQFGGNSTDLPEGVAVDGPGNVYVVGSSASEEFFPQDCDPTCRNQSRRAPTDSFVVTYQSDSVYRWMHRIGAERFSASDQARASAIVVTDAIYYVGRFGGRLQIAVAAPTVTFDSRGGEDAFVMSLASGDGAFRWALHVGGAAEDRLETILQASDGDLRVGGALRGTMTTPAGWAMTAVGPSDVLIGQVGRATGAAIAATRHGGAGDDGAQSLAPDGLGALIVGGHMNAPIDLGHGAIVGEGAQDLFVLRSVL